MNKRLLAIVIIVAIAAVVAVIYLSMQGGTSTGTTRYDNVLADPSIIGALTSVPNSTLASVGIGAAGGSIRKLTSSPALTQNGKPEVLYIGGEFCPYCAAERWAMIIALSRFGTFSNLHYMTSSESDPVAPGTPTFTFRNSTYQSQYISFLPIEEYSNILQNNTYTILQPLNDTIIGIVQNTYPGGGIPYINFGNKTVIAGSTYAPQILQGMNWTQIVQRIGNANSTVSQSILGSANLLTAQICKATNMTPQSVCGASYIKHIISVT
ncbi:MAG: DUF929 family protein [Candidatus Micrarchaeota archaeon]|nr:DUF929 family protein [Candidatus Micrarchaeota archaeon]